MAGSMMLKLVCVMVACMVVYAPNAEAVSCGQVVSLLTPCINYLKGAGPLVPNCCSGVKTLNGMAKTTRDRQTACGCLKQAASGVAGLKPALSAGLPGKCSVNIPFKISPSTDCTKVR